MKNFKKYLIGLIGIFFFSPIFAQVEEKPEANAETLFGQSTNIRVGVAASVFYNGSGIDGDFAHTGGAKLGLVFNNRLSAGAFLQRSGEIRPESSLSLDYMDLRMAGGYVEYTILPDKLVHFTFPIMFGVGEVELDERESWGDVYEEANFAMIEPQALLEINLHKYVRLNAGVGYRWVSDVNYNQITDQDISGLTGTIGLKIGLFR